MRVPTPNVSCVDLAAILDRTVTAEEVNATFQAAADGPLKGILACSHEELVSIDFKGNPHSSIVDMPYTKVMDGDFLKVLSWYDNEWGYSNRCVDLLRQAGQERPVKLSIRDLDSQGPARLHPRRLQRPAEGRRDRRRHADPIDRCRRSSTRSTTARRSCSRAISGARRGRSNPQMSLRPIADRLADLLGHAGDLRHRLHRRPRRRARCSRSTPRAGRGAAREPAVPPRGGEERPGVREGSWRRWPIAT